MSEAPASVWLLDDSRLEAAMALRVLGDELAVEWFTDGETLLEQLSHRRPSVLVLDAQLPGISGLEVCRFVRGAFDELTLPVLFLTAHESQADVVDVLAAGANDYVRKPYDGSELKARVRTVVRLVKANEKRQIAETRAATGEQRLRELLVQAPAAIAIWRGPQHVFALANARCEQLLGRSDLVGRTLRQVFPELEGQGLFEIFDEVWATGAPFYTGDYRTGVTRSGESKSTERFYAFNLVPTHDNQGAIDGLMAVAVDVTDVVRARQGAQDLAHALATNVKRAQLAADVGAALTADSSTHASLTICAQAMVRHLDAAFARIWTLAPGAEVLELQASAGLYTHLDGPHSRVPVGALKIGRIARERAPHLTNDVANDPGISDREWARREGIVAFAGYPLLVDQRAVGVVALFARQPLPPMLLADLAAVAHVIALGVDRAYAEGERARLLASEHEARLQAERSNRAKDEFLAVVSHELRTPLNAVLGWARLLSDGRTRSSLPQDATRRGLETIERNALAQAQLIEDLLDVSRITMGKLRLEVGPLSLIGVIEAGMESVRPAADAKDLKLECALERPAELVGLKILVVDYDADTRELVALVLRRCGAAPTAVASAEEALAALQREPWDVLLSDVGMPGKDGYALIRRVRSEEKQRGGRIPAAVLTAYARAEDRLHALDAGYQMHVPKPVEPSELVAVVAALARIGSAMRHPQ